MQNARIGLVLPLIFLWTLGLLEACNPPPAPEKIKFGKASANSSGDEDKGKGKEGGPKEGSDVADTRDTSKVDPMDKPIDDKTGATDPKPVDPLTPVDPVPSFIPCKDQSEKCHPHKMILADYSLGKIIYVNLDDPTKDWDVAIPGGVRDLQLIGGNKVLVGTGEVANKPYGWHEVDIATGKIVKSVTGLTGPVLSVQRLVNGNTLLIGTNLLGGSGIVVVETNDKKEVISKREFKGVANSRTVRRTRDGNFLLGNQTIMLELRPDGKEVWRADVGAKPAYMGLKLANGQRVVANGHGGKIFTYDAKTGLKIKTVTLPNILESETQKPFASAFAVLPNGNYVTTNWAGPGKTLGKFGPQVAEYTPDGKEVWKWNQPADRISAIYAVLVLDNLDLSKAHDDSSGPLEPVKLKYP